VVGLRRRLRVQPYSGLGRHRERPGDEEVRGIGSGAVPRQGGGRSTFIVSRCRYEGTPAVSGSDGEEVERADSP
jgi:hypothetical protein